MPTKSVSINCLVKALVPLDEKSSESVPERVLPYRHLLERYTSANQNFSKQKGMMDINTHPSCHKFKENVPTQPPAHLEHQRSLLSVP